MIILFWYPGKYQIDYKYCTFEYTIWGNLCLYSTSLRHHIPTTYYLRLRVNESYILGYNLINIIVILLDK